MHARGPTLPSILVIGLLLAGCSGKDDAPELGVFSRQSDGAFETEHRFDVPPGTPVVVLDMQWQAGPGFDFLLMDDARTGIAGWPELPGNSSFARFSTPLAGARTGTWELDVECPQGCEYTFTFTAASNVALTGSMQGRYTDATARVAQASTGEHEAGQSVIVPTNASRLEVHASWQSAGAMDFDIVDPDVEFFGGGSSRFAIVAEGFTHIVHDPEPGEYEVVVDCETDCEYVAGFYVS